MAIESCSGNHIFMCYNPIMQGEDFTFIARTAAATRTLLAVRGWTQTRFAKEISADQPWVSNLLRGELREVSGRVRDAHNYVSQAFQTDGLPEAVVEAVRGYLASGGDAALLADWIWSLAPGRRPRRAERLRSQP